MNRVKNAQNWFEIIGPRGLRLSQPSARLVPRNIICIQHRAPSGNHRVGDSWETVTYTVLWLCGLVAIGLCWV
jgi:hypothetical protein